MRDEIEGEIKDFDDDMREKIQKNYDFAQQHINLIKKTHQERIESGTYSEYANMLVSIKNSEQVKQ